MLLICIFIIIILGIIIVKRPRTIIWMGRYIRNKLLLFIQLSEPEQCRAKTTCARVYTAAQNSNVFLSRKSEALPRATAVHVVCGNRENLSMVHP